MFTIFKLISALITFALSLYGFNHKNRSGVIYFTFLMLTLSLWACSSFIQDVMIQHNFILNIESISFIFIAFLPVFLFLFIFEFTNGTIILSRRYFVFLSIIPFLTVLIVFTNSYTHLFWVNEVHIQEEAIKRISAIPNGLWFIFHTIYSYVLILLSILLIVNQVLNSPPIYRCQSVLLLISISFPFLFNVIEVFILPTLSVRDFTTIGFSITGILFFLEIYYFDFFKVIPLARNYLIDNIIEGMIILNQKNLIIDINSYSLHFFKKRPKEVLGKDIKDIMTDWFPYFHLLDSKSEVEEDVCIKRDEEEYWLNMMIVPIYDPYKNYIGKIITLKNITQNKIAELRERKLKSLFEIQNENLKFLWDFSKMMYEINNIDLLIKKALDKMTEIPGIVSAWLFDIDNHQNSHRLYSSKLPKMMEEELEKKCINCHQFKRNLLKIPLLQSVEEPCVVIKRYQMSFDESTFIINSQLRISDHHQISINLVLINLPPSEFEIKKGLFTNSKSNYSKTMDEILSSQQQSFLNMIIEQFSVSLERAHYFQEIEEMATYDFLTKVYNRHNFFALAKKEIERTKRYKRSFSLIMIDIDYFKNINDEYGHLIGDQVINYIAQFWLNSLRHVDIMGRFGGEEFVVLLPETHYEQALMIAERIHNSFISKPLQIDKIEIKITFSAGVSEYNLDDATESLDLILERADKALYQAKTSGRNQVRGLLK